MDLKIASFEISFIYECKIYKAEVEQSFLSDINERFKVTGGKKSFEIISDRPMIRKTGGKKKIKMQAIGVNVAFKDGIENIIEQIQQHIYKLEHPPIDWSTHPKNNPY